MENVSEIEKKTLRQRLLEFQKAGLISYGKYLAEQQEFASKSESRKAYEKYVQDQIEMNNMKIKDLEEQLSK